MIGTKKLAVGVTSIAVAGTALVPVLASASGAPGATAEAILGSTSPPAAVAFTQQAPEGERVGPAHGRGGFGLRGGLGGHGGFRGRGVIGSVLEQFDVTREDYRAAATAVRDQFGPESRPDVDRPLDDDERALLEAYGTTRRAAIASELGIDPAAFEQAVQDAKAEAQAAHEARRSERLRALADALGVTVEDLQEAFESLRGQFQQQPSSGSQTSA